MTERLIRQDVIDAQIDVVMMLLHPASFTQIGKKASPMELKGSGQRLTLQKLKLLALDLAPIFLGEKAAGGLGFHAHR